MQKLVLAIVIIFIFGCKNEVKNDKNSTEIVYSARDSSYLKDSILVQGDKREEENPIAKVMITSDKAGLQHTNEKARLEDEFDFLLDHPFEINYKITVGNDKPIPIENQRILVDKNGTYVITTDQGESKGLWQGKLGDGRGIISLYPFDANEKNSEWKMLNMNSKI